jgi:anti-sigma B factor antagonist
MTIAVIEEPQACILRLLGEVDASTCLEVDTAMEAALRKPITALWIDCTGLEYISSAGLGVLISHMATMEERQINFVLYGMKAHVQDVFELLGLHMIMNILPTKLDAVLQVK